MQQFKNGDSVALKSGGPTMTILQVGEDLTDWISCRWYDGKKFNTELFPSESLRLVDDSDGGVHVA